MMNHSYEGEDQNKQSEAIANLEKEIQNQNKKFIDMEHKHGEKAIIMSKLMTGLLENIDSRQKSLLEMENKYNESLNMMMKLMGEGDTMHEDCHREIQQLKVMNSNLSHGMECIKKEKELVSKELKEHKALNALQQKNFTEVIHQNATRIIVELRGMAVQLPELEKSVMEVEAENERLKAKNKELENQLSILQILQEQASWCSCCDIDI